MKYLSILTTIIIFCSCQKTDLSNARTTQQDTLVVAAGAIIPVVKNVANSLIEWKFTTQSSGHDRVNLDSVKALPNGNIRVYYPKVKRVVSWLATGDDILSKYATVGYTVGFDYCDMNIGTIVANAGEIKGNNTSNWTKSERLNNWDIVRDTTTGLTRLNVATSQGVLITTSDYNTFTASYTGSNIRFIKRVYSGTGNYNVGFYLTDFMGNIIKGKTDPNDRITLSCGVVNINVNAYRVGTNLYEYTFFKEQSAIIIQGYFYR